VRAPRKKIKKKGEGPASGLNTTNPEGSAKFGKKESAGALLGEKKKGRRIVQLFRLNLSSCGPSSSVASV